MSGEDTLISVVMAVYNGEAHLADTIESVLRQTYTNFEFVIVDDGSTDGSSDILRAYADRDRRIHPVFQKNAGLTRALIRGVSASRGEVIARQDVGDRSLPGRLASQHAYLEHNRDVVAVGCGLRRIGPAGEWLGDTCASQTPQQVTNRFLAGNGAIPHAASMFWRSAYEACGGYRVAFRYAQDHDLWYKMTEHGLLGECPEVLFEMRLELQGISAQQHGYQRRLAALAKLAYEARAAGQSDLPMVTDAKAVSEASVEQQHATFFRRHQQARSAYFIGSQLVQCGDLRGRTYLLRAMGSPSLFPKATIKYVRSLWASRTALNRGSDFNAK